jgi:transcriptional regulator with XRE-family HTH domain
MRPDVSVEWRVSELAALDWHSEEMAQLAGITVLTLKRIEAGTSSPSLRTVEQLLRPLGLKLAIVKRSVSAEKPAPV